MMGGTLSEFNTVSFFIRHTWFQLQYYWQVGRRPVVLDCMNVTFLVSIHALSEGMAGVQLSVY